MNRVIWLLLSGLLLLSLFGCAASKTDETDTTETVAETIDYKNEPINQWIPYTPPAEMQEDLATPEGEVIEFKSLYYVRDGIQEPFCFISSAEQLDLLFEKIGSCHLLSSTHFYESVEESKDDMKSQLQKIDFRKYDLMICGVFYSSSDLGFDGNPLVCLLKCREKLVCVFQSNWSGGGANMDIWNITAFVLVKKNQNLPENISSSEVLIFNPNHRDVANVYHGNTVHN